MNKRDESPVFNVEQMSKLVENESFLKMVFNDLIQQGNAPESVLETLFWSEVAEDSVYSFQYNKFASK